MHVQIIEALFLVSKLDLSLEVLTVCCSYLAHELWDHTVERGSLEGQGLA